MLTFTLVGCSDSGMERSDTGQRPSSELVEFDAGTSIGEGFVVPDETTMMLQPVPSGPLANENVPWTAHLLSEDPVVTFNAFAEQATDLGFELFKIGDDPCYSAPVLEALTELPASWSLGAPLPPNVAVQSIDCVATGAREVAGVTQTLFIQSTRDYATQIGARSSVTFDPVGAVYAANVGGLALTPSEVLAPDAPVDTGPPAVGAGEPLAPTTGGPLTLVEGSRLVTPIDDVFCQSGVFAVLDVTGDPSEVFGAYVDQVAEWAEAYGSPPKATSLELLGRQVDHTSTHIVENAEVHIAMVTGINGEPTRMLVNSCDG